MYFIQVKEILSELRTANSGLVSLIMPVYNTVDFVEFAFISVIGQTYQDWELLVIDDGSTDKSLEIIEEWAGKDQRIKVFHQQNGGVSKARNTGLLHARGKFLCFLDSDDWLPPNSLEVRVRKINESKSIDFVDGRVDIFSEDGTRNERTWKPAFKGNPYRMLLKLSPRCFFGPTWMIRIRPGQNVKFDETLKHGEDLLFYVELSQGEGHYDYVDDVVYCYRNRTGSAMKNVEGVLNGYLSLRHVLARAGRFSAWDHLVFEYKIKRIMFLTLIREGNIWKAMQYMVR